MSGDIDDLIAEGRKQIHRAVGKLLAYDQDKLDDYNDAVKFCRRRLFGRGLSADELMDEYYRFRPALTPIQKALWLDAIAPAMLGARGLDL